jgi:hypothetical protein
VHLAWESQRDQTHLVLATMLSAATVFVFLRLVRTRNAVWYALFGVAAGAGIMAKYNFIFLLIGLLLAALASPTGRSSLFDRRSVLALAVLVLVTGPHLVWMLQNSELLVSQSYKFGIAETGNGEPGALHGLFKLLKGTAEFAVVPVVFLLFLRLVPRGADPDVADQGLARLLWRTMVMALAVAAVAVVLFGVTNVKSRWLQPLFLCIPIIVVYAGRARLTPLRQRTLFFAVMAVATIILTAVNGTVLAAKWLHRPNNLNVAFDVLAQQIRDAGFSRGSLISNDIRVAGNLLKEFPESVALVPTMAYFHRRTGEPLLLVWDAGGHTELPSELVEFATQLLGSCPTNPPCRIIQAPGHHGDPGTCQLGFVLLPPEQSPGVATVQLRVTPSGADGKSGAGETVTGSPESKR